MVWIIFVGWWPAIGHIAIALAVADHRDPLAIPNLKLIPVSLLPLGRVIVNSDELRTALAPGQFRELVDLSWLA